MDQLDCAAFLGFEVPARRVQAIIDADAQDARNPTGTTIARHFRSACGVEDGVGPSLVWRCTVTPAEPPLARPLLVVQTMGMRKRNRFPLSPLLAGREGGGN